MSNLPTAERFARPIPQTDGTLMYAWTATPARQSDPVVLRVPRPGEPTCTLPIVFVPGIMGTNLQATDEGARVWNLDTSHIPFIGDVPFSLVTDKVFETAGERQKLLHPARTEVDGGGMVPPDPAGSILDVEQYRERGWGEVGAGSYHEFMLKLDCLLNDHRMGRSKTTVEAQIAELMAVQSGDDSDWRPMKGPPIKSQPADYENLHNWFFPVHACGYNWLDDNAVAAKRLKARIEEIIAQFNNPSSRCEQVILVTHSMGGLVARACQQLDGMQDKIAGIVHGVMPANGAAVAYRRCKVGMRDEDYAASLVIGKSGQEVTAVFAQAPGALELLPTQKYKKNWLKVLDVDGKTVLKSLHDLNPYDEIYRRRDRWWALVKEEWLSPEGGAPIDWDVYSRFLDKAEDFHIGLTDQTYHPNTYAFYGADNKNGTASFENVVWQMKRGNRVDNEPVPSRDEVLEMTAQQVHMDGTTPEHVGWREVRKTRHIGRDQVTSTVEVSQWELHVNMQDETGDGTVPASSGRAPADCSAVKQVFRLTGVRHEPAYRESTTAYQVTVYSISKIALEARVPPKRTIATAKA